MTTESCPCQSGKPLNQCCGPILEGKAQAQTAEALMRSRYTAYATNQIDYLERSHAPGEAHTFNRSAAEAWSEEADWLGLKIIATQGGDTKDREGVVEFIARYIWDSKEEEHHERALFLKIDGQWYFVGGKLVETDNDDGASPKIGRSMPCPCGSGKKYKKCCAA